MREREYKRECCRDLMDSNRIQSKGILKRGSLCPKEGGLCVSRSVCTVHLCVCVYCMVGVNRGRRGNCNIKA